MNKKTGKKLLKPKIDVVFHALFRNENKRLTEYLISDILGEKSELRTSDLSRHLNIKVANQKLGVLDLRTEMMDGTQCAVEVQLEYIPYESERFLYYWADDYSRQLEKGDQYKKLHKTISIIILNHEIRALKGMNELDVKWQIRDSKTGQRLLTDNLEIVIIEIPKAMRVYEKDKNNRIAQWMMFLNDPNDKEVLKIMEENEGIKETVEELKVVSDNEELRRIAQLREKGIRDEQAGREYAREQGFKQGLEQGVEQGLEKGVEQALMKTAQNMLKKDIEVEVICEITGLTREEVEEIKIA